MSGSKPLCMYPVSGLHALFSAEEDAVFKAERGKGEKEKTESASCPCH